MQADPKLEQKQLTPQQREPAEEGIDMDDSLPLDSPPNITDMPAVIRKDSINPYEQDNFGDILGHKNDPASFSQQAASMQQEEEDLLEETPDKSVGNDPADKEGGVNSSPPKLIAGTNGEGMLESPKAFMIDDKSLTHRESTSSVDQTTCNVFSQNSPANDVNRLNTDTDIDDADEDDTIIEDKVDEEDQFAFSQMRSEVTEADETKELPHPPIVENIKYRSAQSDATPRGNFQSFTRPTVPVSVMSHSQTEPNETSKLEKAVTTQKKSASLQDKVFSKLLQEEHNQNCFDCGWEDPTHVSINHGIFLCANCATGIHIEHYPVEVSYIKAIFSSHFAYPQLRVMINGGNKAAFDFFELYDLHNEPVQKRYNTVAAQYYRDRIKGVLEQGFLVPSAEDRTPSFDEGRKALKSQVKQTPQIKPYSQLNHREILSELLTWEHIGIELSKEDGGVKPGQINTNLLGKFDKYMEEKELENRKLHEQITQLKKTPFKNKKQAQAVLDTLPAPDPSLPPFSNVENEPYSDSSSFKFNDDAVLDKLNDFADSTIKMGESFFRRISQSDFFSRGGASNNQRQENEKVGEAEESKDGSERSVQESIQEQADAEGEPTVGSVLAGQRPGPAPIGGDPDVDGRALRYNNLREKTADKLISAGKSFWGYLTSAAATAANATQQQQEGHQQQ